MLDGRSVLTGSYNWTRGAARDNRENFMLTWAPEAVRSFSENFDRMWREMAPKKG